jgi:hypothetical protein
VADVAKQLGISVKSLYKWRRESEQKNNPAGSDVATLKLEVTKLNAALKRTTEERYIKKGRRVLCQSVRLSSMCRVLKVHRSGFYSWKASPLSKRAIADEKLLTDIKRSYNDS